MATKQDILLCALQLFSRQGYEQVSVREIAAALEIKAPSLYKHYASKEAIKEALLNFIDTHYQKSVALVNLGGLDSSKDYEQLAQLTPQTLLTMGQYLFRLFSEDELMVSYRRWLTIEQFHHPEMKARYGELYYDQPIHYQQMFFQRWLSISEEDALQLAYRFYSPILVLIQSADCFPKRQASHIQILNEHLSAFSTYIGEHYDLKP